MRTTLAGTYAYIADGFAGLHVIDISDPIHPVRVGGYDTSGYAGGVAVSGNYAYVADGTNGLQVIDIRDPANPVLAGALLRMDGLRRRKPGRRVW
jgi:hypothetical protein